MSVLVTETLQSLEDGSTIAVKDIANKSSLIDRSNYSSDAAFNAAKVGKLSIDASKRLRTTSYIAGTEELTGAALRDAMVVGRNVVGTTDCHAFADRTIMSGVTDAGTYGTFDATTRLQGSNNQNHLYAFQHRCSYEGTNALQQFAGFLSRPVHAGTGSINESYGADIGTISITSGGSVVQQTGVRVRDQTGAAVNVGLNVEQTTGYSLFAAGGAPLHNKGRAGFGITPNTSYALQYAGTAVSARRGFAETTATAVQIGGEGDGTTQFITNAQVKLQINNAANNYDVSPGSDNVQGLGRANARFVEGYITTLRPGIGTVIWTSGVGTPEGVVTAPVGSLFTRTDGGASTTLYVKQSGSGNTGWVAK